MKESTRSNGTVFPELPRLLDGGVVRGSRVFALSEALHFNRGKGQGKVPAQFKTDGASVPRAFWGLFPPLGELFGLAIIHDWEYYLQKIPRKQADRNFLEGMKKSGKGLVKRQVVYRSVRMFGWRAWRKNRVRPMSHFWLDVGHQEFQKA